MFNGNYSLKLASGDFGDLISSRSSFSSASKLPFSASDRWLRSSFRTRFVSSSGSTIPLVCWFIWHSMVFWLMALFVNTGRLISHISARGSIFILETMVFLCVPFCWLVFDDFNFNEILITLCKLISRQFNKFKELSYGCSLSYWIRLSILRSIGNMRRIESARLITWKFSLKCFSFAIQLNHVSLSIVINSNFRWNDSYYALSGVNWLLRWFIVNVTSFLTILNAFEFHLSHNVSI